MQLLQSRALPLGDVAEKGPVNDGERETGIEPATFSLARRCSTTEPLPLTLPCFRMCKISYLRGFVKQIFFTSSRILVLSTTLLRVPNPRVPRAPDDYFERAPFQAEVPALRLPGCLPEPAGKD